MAETASIATATPTPPPASPPAAAAPPAAAPAPQGAASRPGFIPDSQFDRLDPTEQGKYARVSKGPDGGSEWIERSKLPSESGADPAATADPSATAQPLVPSETYKFGDLDLTGQEILDLLKFKGETELRRASVPADPSGYQIALPQDFVLPAGMDFKFNEADPALAAARAWSHQQGLNQDQFSSLLAQYAGLEATREATFRAAMKRELDALGANATMRVTALETWLKGMVPGEIAKSMVAGLFSEKQVRGLELLANKMATQGHAPFSQAHREPAGPQGRVSEEEYNAMGPSERWDYARGFDQKQFSNGGR
jgi:hypothetical protein